MDFGTINEEANSVVVQSDGKIVVAGFSNGELAMARLNGDGALDASFGGSGTLKPNIGTGSQPRTSMVLQADGKIVVTVDDSNTNHEVGFVRLNNDGSQDTSFGGDGILVADFGTQGSLVKSTVLQTDGKFVVTGEGGNGDFALARYINTANEPVVVNLPNSGGSVIALISGGELHVRRSRTSPDLVPPVALDRVSKIQIVGSDHSDRVTLDRSLNSFTGTLTFNGNDGNDTLDVRAVALNLTFNGGDDNDTFLGGSGNDSVDGGSGDDSLTGGNGNDSIHGGADNDRITGDAGNDVLFGGTGNDSMRGGTGEDTLLGEAGNDTLVGDGGNDVIDGGDDRDNLQGSDGNDSLRGGNGNDTMSGGKGNDLLTGSAGNDLLRGDAGIDTLLGDSGNDTLDGGSGIDIINPGSGTNRITDSSRVINNTFIFDFEALLGGLV